MVNTFDGGDGRGEDIKVYGILSAMVMMMIILILLVLMMIVLMIMFL